MEQFKITPIPEIELYYQSEEAVAAENRARLFKPPKEKRREQGAIFKRERNQRRQDNLNRRQGGTLIKGRYIHHQSR